MTENEIPSIATQYAMIFGAMQVYSTCRDCRTIMQVTAYGDTNHPSCQPKPRRMERLAEQFLKHCEAGEFTEAEQLKQQIDTFDSEPPLLRESALWYASMGWPVFPLKPYSKSPATEHGYKDATTDAARIDAYWRKHPDANIGVPTGVAFDVLDVDVPQGITSFVQMMNDGKLGLPHTWHGIVSTASGGMHLLHLPSATRNRASLGHNGSGVDWRGSGGYVVAPPSTLGEPGRSWSWTVEPSPKLVRLKGTAVGNRLTDEQINEASQCK